MRLLKKISAKFKTEKVSLTGKKFERKLSAPKIRHTTFNQHPSQICNSKKVPVRSISFKEISEKRKAKKLYEKFVYTTMYRIGRKGGMKDVLANDKMYRYGQRVFRIDEDDHKLILNKVQEMDIPDTQLNLHVFEASGLDAKDANGLSDPFCTIYLINASDINPEKRRLSMRIPSLDTDSLFKATKVVPKTLNPVWDQDFTFDVRDVSEQVLHIDVWDRDEEVELDSSNRITSIKGFRGAGRFVKEMYQNSRSSDGDSNDDFLGLIDVPLKTVTDKEFDIWLQLQPRNVKKVVSGKLHVKFSLSFKQCENNISLIGSSSTSAVYKNFLTSFAQNEWDRSREEHKTPDYSFSLCPEAAITLSNFVLQHNIPIVHVNAMQWEVYSKLYCENQFFPLDVLVELLETHQNMAKEQCDLQDDRGFLSSLDEFIGHAFKLLDDYRYTFQADDSNKCSQLGKLIKCVQMIYEFPSFKQRHPRKSITDDIQKVIEQSTINWVHRVQSFNKVVDAYHEVKTDQEECPCSKLNNMVHVIHAVTEYIKEENKEYAPYFEKLNIRYFSIVFNTVESLLSEMVEQGTKNLEEELMVENEINQDGLGTKLFELYLGVRSLLELKRSIPESERNEEGVCNYSKWFKKCAIKWNYIATEKAKAQIANAIELDKVQVIDEMVKHSSSAVDVTCCLGQICTFWKRLDWPDPSDAFMLVAHITDIVGECGRYYVDIIFQKLKDKGFYDDIGQFDVTRELCIMMNNAAHVIEFFNHAPQALQFDKILHGLKELHGEERIPLFQGTLERIIRCAKDAMYCKIEKILDNIGARMRESMTPIIEKILQSKRESPEVMSDPLVKYVESNLITLNTALLSKVFFRILRHFWNDFLQCSQNLIKTKGDKMYIENYSILYDLVEMMKLYFYGDGNGLTDDELECDIYWELIEYLEIYKLPTGNLIEKFFLERYEKQKEVTWEMGSLTFKIYYDSMESKLKILIMNCRNLLAMDSDGESDPYVVVELKPSHLFSGLSTYKTKYIEDTLTPLFDEEFEFEVSAEDCANEGATLLFTLYDHDMVKDKKMGTVYYNLQQVSCEPSDMEDQFSIYPQIELPITNMPLVGEVYKALRSRRKHDKMAANFVDQLKWL